MSMKDFQIISRLGEGSYSSVWKVKRISDGKEYGMKKVKLAALSEKEKENALNEVRILASIDDPYIIRYKESFFEDNSMTLCIVMEYAGGGDVYNKIVHHQKHGTFFSEEDIWRMFIQMVKGLKSLHDMNILHRDLKCANIFIGSDNKTAKLGDLNVSIHTKGNLAYTQTGTPYYASPEVWKDQPYDAKSDIWSLGCVLYEITALKPPFRANDMEGLYKKVQRGLFDRLPSHYSVDLYNIICQCLQVSPSMRPSSDQILNNPIVMKNGRDILGPALLNHTDSKTELLKTIKMPKNPKTLGQQLPKANYQVHQSLEVEKGKLTAKIEVVNRINGEKGKRAISAQQTPNNVNIIPIRSSQSRESRIQEMNKNQQKETEMKYLQRMQKEYIDRAKVIKNMQSPKHSIENISPKERTHLPVNRAIVRQSSGINSNANEVKSINKQPSYGMKQDIVKDRVSKQDELINKYQNRAYDLVDKSNKEQSYQKILSEKDNFSKNADYLIQKYQQPLPVQQQRYSNHYTPQQPLQPIQLLSTNTKPNTPLSGHRGIMASRGEQHIPSYNKPNTPLLGNRGGRVEQPLQPIQLLSSNNRPLSGNRGIIGSRGEQPLPSYNKPNSPLSGNRGIIGSRGEQPLPSYNKPNSPLSDNRRVIGSRGEQPLPSYNKPNSPLSSNKGGIGSRGEQPLQPIRLLSSHNKPSTPSSGNRGGIGSKGDINSINNNPQDVIGKYSNIYNLKSKHEMMPDYSRKAYDRDISSPYGNLPNSSSGGRKQPDYQYVSGGNKPVIYQNNFNHIRSPPVQKNSNRPVWGGGLT